MGRIAWNMASKQTWSPTADQQFCIDVLADWAGGRHHLPHPAPYGTGVCVCESGDLSTTDADGLTRLVLTAHRHAVRISLSGTGGPRRLKIIAHRRSHGKKADMKFWDWHPDLADLAARIQLERK